MISKQVWTTVRNPLSKIQYIRAGEMSPPLRKALAVLPEIQVSFQTPNCGSQPPVIPDRRILYSPLVSTGTKHLSSGNANKHTRRQYSFLAFNAVYDKILWPKATRKGKGVFRLTVVVHHQRIQRGTQGEETGTEAEPQRNTACSPSCFKQSRSTGSGLSLRWISYILFQGHVGVGISQHIGNSGPRSQAIQSPLLGWGLPPT